MFESGGYESLRETARELAVARGSTGLATNAQLCDAARAVQAAQDVLDGVQSDLLARIEEAKAFEDESASTASSWAVRELRLTPGQARARVKAGHTLRQLPDAAQALSAGQIRLGHVFELTAGLKKLGADTMADLQDILVPLAKTTDPSGVRAAVSHVHETLYPEQVDDALAKGMDRRDVQLGRTSEGYHISGFLDAVTGAKLHAFLKAASAATDDGDDRAPSQRRVDALGRLVDTGAEQGEPGTGIRPQIHVIADLEFLLGHDGAEPAQLAGFGTIGRDLLGYLTCTGDITGVLTHGDSGGPVPQAAVLNVGRTQRLATPAQRSAVITRQDGICANPGCTNTLLEVHHVAWWDRDTGPTDLANLVGICSGCHHLVHRDKLTVEPDGAGGFTFGRSSGRKIDDHRRRTRRRIRRMLRRLLRNAQDEKPEHPAVRSTEPAARPDAPTTSPAPDPEPPGTRRPRPPLRQPDPSPAQSRSMRGCGYQIHRIRYTDLNSGDDPPPF